MADSSLSRTTREIDLMFRHPRCDKSRNSVSHAGCDKLNVSLKAVLTKEQDGKTVIESSFRVLRQT